MTKLKIAAATVGGLFAVAHIGLLGYIIRQPDKQQVYQVPTINIPRGTPYSSYKIQAGKDGYSIEYKANDPKVLESERSVDLVQTRNKKGLFGGADTFEDRKESRRDQYTMEGVRNMGQKVPSICSLTRFIRPPVWVFSPVSTSVTFQGSALRWWTCISLFVMSKVTSDICRK